MYINDFYGFISIERGLTERKVAGIKGEADVLPLNYSRNCPPKYIKIEGKKRLVAPLR